MVKILNGEVVNDDDPRLRAVQQKSAEQKRGGVVPPSVGEGPSPKGLLGLPCVTVFDVLLKPEMYLAAAALCIFGGTSGMFGTILLFFGYRYHLQKQQQGQRR